MARPGRFEVSVETRFRAAHALREYRGATEPAHRHGFRVVVTVSGRKVDRAGMLIDFALLKPLLQEEVGRFGAGFLNDTVKEFRLDGGGLSPSAENVARVLFRRLKPRLPRSVKLARVQVSEVHGCAAAYSE